MTLANEERGVMEPQENKVLHSRGEVPIVQGLIPPPVLNETTMLKKWTPERATETDYHYLPIPKSHLPPNCPF